MGEQDAPVVLELRQDRLERCAWDDHSLGQADALEHLGALDLVSAGDIESHREAIEKTDGAWGRQRTVPLAQ